MELKWLEDLLVLLEEKSVTRAARRRHVTQPAFSRRIRQLEHWLGLEIVDRRTKPISILPTGLLLEDGVRDLVNRHYALRNSVHGKPDIFTFVAQHTLAISLFPRLIRRIKKLLPDTNYRVITADNNACESLFLKQANFLLYYQAGHRHYDLSPMAVHSIKLGSERLLPVASKGLADELGSLSPGNNLPLLMYQPGGFMAEVLANNCLPEVMRDFRVEQICESAFSASLKEMVMADMGVAWLGSGMIEKELNEGSMVSYEPTLGSAELDIVLCYRDDAQSVRLGKLIAGFERVGA